MIKLNQILYETLKSSDEIFIDDIKKFFKFHSALISPIGEIFPSTQYDHFFVLTRNVPKYKKLNDLYKKNNEEFPGNKVFNHAYKDGWSRIDYYLEERTIKLEIKGLETTINKRMNDLKDIGEILIHEYEKYFLERGMDLNNKFDYNIKKKYFGSEKGDND